MIASLSVLFGSVSIALISFASYLYKTEQENLVRGERDALPLFCFVSYAAIEYMLKTLLTLLYALISAVGCNASSRNTLPRTSVTLV